MPSPRPGPRVPHGAARRRRPGQRVTAGSIQISGIPKKSLKIASSSIATVTSEPEGRLTKRGPEAESS
jgi:hypothetical protein